MCVLVAQSCPTLCDPMDFSLPGSSVCGILQARILEWIAIPFFIPNLWYCVLAAQKTMVQVNNTTLPTTEFKF